MCHYMYHYIIMLHWKTQIRTFQRLEIALQLYPLLAVLINLLYTIFRHQMVYQLQNYIQIHTFMIMVLLLQ